MVVDVLVLFGEPVLGAALGVVVAGTEAAVATVESLV